MPITINGIELCDAEVEQELPLHQDSDNPLHQAVLARILRRVMLDEAARLGLDTTDEEQALAALLAREAPSPEPDEAACRRFYAANTQRFSCGDCVEADHILFQVTPQVPLDALRIQAQNVLAQALDQPQSFAELARRYSNCPSAQLGGNLGQLGKGDTVSEFERALFALEAGKVHPHLINSRHGLHIVRVRRSVPGRLLPYDAVAGEIATVLAAMARDTAWRQYAKVLVARAHIDGIDLAGQAEGENIMGAAQPRAPQAPAHAGCGCGTGGCG